MNDNIKIANLRTQLSIFFVVIIFLYVQQWAYAANNPNNIIVDVNWLKSSMSNSNNLRLIDVRTEKEFIAGHIPGASNLPVAKSFEGSRIVSLASIRKILSQLGISNSDKLVIYDDGKMKDAAHVFWMLETYGHNSISTLDGGINAWVNTNNNLSTDVIKYPKHAYIPRVSPERLTTKLSARLAIENKNTVIIDSRLEDEYKGLKSKARRSGHIPGAINIMAGNNLNASPGSSTLKPIDQLKSMYNRIDKSKKVITYCNRGKDSALTYLIMRSLDYDVSVYDGGWLEWGDDLHLPIEKPTK